MRNIVKYRSTSLRAKAGPPSFSCIVGPGEARYVLWQWKAFDKMEVLVVLCCGLDWILATTEIEKGLLTLYYCLVKAAHSQSIIHKASTSSRVDHVRVSGYVLFTHLVAEGQLVEE